ncbi:hypothetical protein BRD04_04900 [Halobacteriales archaeon QS_9_67_17]|nr:MAG: hypothetical protein BRD04_04900 [Halobacteriales archaeon QS_9_67_17]
MYVGTAARAVFGYVGRCSAEKPQWAGLKGAVIGDFAANCSGELRSPVPTEGFLHLIALLVPELTLP